jgi:hypothetical protein
MPQIYAETAADRTAFTIYARDARTVGVDRVAVDRRVIDDRDPFPEEMRAAGFHLLAADAAYAVYGATPLPQPEPDITVTINRDAIQVRTAAGMWYVRTLLLDRLRIPLSRHVWTDTAPIPVRGIQLPTSGSIEIAAGGAFRWVPIRIQVRSP